MRGNKITCYTAGLKRRAVKYANQTLLKHLAKGAVDYAHDLGYDIPIVLHLDHGDTFELWRILYRIRFSSVMIDGSHHPYDKNVELTRQVVEIRT